MGDYEEAAEEFSDAVRIDPDYADAKQRLALTQSLIKYKKIEPARK